MTLVAGTWEVAQPSASSSFVFVAFVASF